MPISAVGPNFSLDMCVEAISAGEAEGLDLSTLTEWYCGAEPVSIDTMTQFEAAARTARIQPESDDSVLRDGRGDAVHRG